MAKNSATLNLPGGLKFNVQGFSNASFQQTVTITPPSGSSAVLAGGKGEGNIPMQLTTQGFLTPGSTSTGSWPSFTSYGTSNQIYSYTVTCTNNGPNTSNVESNQTIYSMPTGGQFYVETVVAEDNSDNDYNDSVIFFTAWSLPTEMNKSVATT